MKKALLFTAILITSFMYSQIPTAGLVKEYKFTNGSLVSGVQPVLQNGAVNLAQTGTTSIVTTDRHSSANGAITFNNDWFESGSIASSNVTNYSFSFWIKTNENDGNLRTIIDQYHFGGNINNRGFTTHMLNGRLQLWSYFTYGNLSYDNQNAVYVNPTFNIADNNWHHVVAVVTTSSTFTTSGINTNRTLINTMKVYIDNALVNTNSQTVNPSYTNANFNYELLHPNVSLKIGSSGGNNPATKFLDIIDDFRFYETELSPSDVNLLYFENVIQTPLYVNLSATGTNDGSSWTNAFTNLQTAIVNNPTNKEIWVASGTYRHYTADRGSSIVFTNGTQLYGGFNGSETMKSERLPKANITIISGDVSGNDNPATNTVLNAEPTRQDNKYHVLQLKNGVQNIIVDGFTISGGNANGGIVTTGTDQYYRTRGGAVQVMLKAANEHVSGVFRNCVFEKNSAVETGVFGVYYYNGINNMSCDVKFESCVFKNNFGNTGSNVQYVGAKTFNWIASGKIANCLFYDNLSYGDASCVYLFASTSGTGQTNLGLDVEILNTTFSSNTGINGRVIRMDNGGNTKIYNSIIWNNNGGNPFYSSNNLFSTTDGNIVQGGAFGANTNPLLNSDYTLQAGSPAINNGVGTYISPSTYSTDLAGNNRFVGNVDIGAYEYDAALSSNTFTTFRDFKVYPNPTSGDLSIYSNENIRNIKVFSLDGKILLETKNTFLEISNYPSGIYFLTLETENGSIGTQKIIKK